jgi:hypothetical protein
MNVLILALIVGWISLADGVVSELPVVFLHFHKAGGTSMCHMFRKTDRKWDGINCNCDFPGVGFPSVYMRSRRLGFCAIERPQLWSPGVVDDRELGNIVLITTLREPFARFLSCYEKDHALLNFEKQDITQKAYLTEHTGNRQWGDYHLPNYYVRFLNGFGTLRGSRTKVSLTRDHLEKAKQILLQFDLVLILERIEGSDSQLAAYTGLTGQLGRATNNHQQGKFPPSEAIGDEFARLNALDIELYDWAVETFAHSV